ncbi:DUF3626 domain-containing protein [Arthrobacter sp. UYP6]|uniref:DUF3626 domain-containing protein n=1 Tax=Arthrobacter sp. UYP6 TaxID=1756378 RepID=UPI003393ADF6
MGKVCCDRWRRYPRRGALPPVAAGRPDPGLDVTIHSHPDTPVNGTTLQDFLAADGLYRSQFETGSGNGGLTAWPGGGHWRWEQRLFGGVSDGGPASQRVKHSEYSRVPFCYPDNGFSLRVNVLDRPLGSASGLRRAEHRVARFGHDWGPAA